MTRDEAYLIAWDKYQAAIVAAKEAYNAAIAKADAEMDAAEYAYDHWTD